MSIARKINAEKESNLVTKIIFTYKPYWFLFTVLLVAAVGAAFLYLKYATPVYEATARVLIKDEKKGVEEAKTVESLDGFSGKNIIENEIEIIKSPNLMDEVVTNLNLYAPVFQKVNFKSTSAYKSCPVKIIADDPGVINAIYRLDFSYSPVNKKVRVGNYVYNLNEEVNTGSGKIKFFENPYFSPAKMGSDTTYFSTIYPLRIVSDRINAGVIATSPNKLSTIIYLKYKDEIPERAENILNALLASYNNSTVTDKNGLTANTLSFIDERLLLLKRDLDSIERKTQQFKARNDAMDISSQGKMFLQNVSNNDQRLGEINMQLAVLNQVDKYISSKNGSGGIVPSTLGIADPTLSVLVGKLYNSELEFEKVKNSTGENNPVATALSDQISKIRPSIAENIQSQRKSLEASRTNLASTNTSFFSTLQGMPEKERQLIDIDRERGTKSQIYNFLLQKREETALSHASTVSNNKIINQARSSENPVSPKKKVIYLASLLIALLAGICIVTAKEKMRGKIMFINDIEELSAYTVIGEISAGNSKDTIVIEEGRRTLIAEQFRKIRLALSYAGVDSSHKRILVTSSISGEGKSFISSNLALSLAITGKKVALLDFDLNNPSLNNKLSAGDHKGITEYLKGECTISEIITPTQQHSNLFLLPTGELPSNPAELIMNGRTEQLLNYLDTIFDYIIIDVAPVAPVTDAYLLAPFCDATLYIIRHNYTPKHFIERLDGNKMLKNIAIVFNGVDKRGFGIKDYGYGYERPSSYGYVYDDTKKKPKLLNNSGK